MIIILSIIFFIYKIYMRKAFPKRIGIVWFQGEQNINKPLFVENVHHWRILNPEWEVVVLDNDMLREICYRYSDACGELYDNFDVMHLKIDFGRYVALYETVGMYVDMDCYAFRSLDRSPIISSFLHSYQTNDHILGLSSSNGNFVENMVSGMSTNNAVMIASPRNPLVKAFIDTIIRNNRNYVKFDPNSSLDVYHHVNTITGPKMFSNFFDSVDMSQFQNVNVHRFPHYIFEPGEFFGNCRITDETVAVHQYEMSWLTPQLKFIAKSYFCFAKPYGFILIIAFLVIWLIYKYYYTDCQQRCTTMFKRD